MPVYEYFETYYIGLPETPGSKKRVVPLFPKETWNVTKRVLENLPRSNNSIESWHKAMSQDINSHPKINKFISHLIKEQHLMEICYEQIKHGVVFQRDKREIKKDEALLSLIKSYEKKNFLSFLDNVIKTLKN